MCPHTANILLRILCNATSFQVRISAKVRPDENGNRLRQGSNANGEYGKTQNEMHLDEVVMESRAKCSEVWSNQLKVTVEDREDVAMG